MRYAQIAFTNKSQLDAVLAAAHGLHDMTTDEINDALGAERLGYDAPPSQVVSVLVAIRRLSSVNSMIQHLEDISKNQGITLASHSHPTRITLSDEQVATFVEILEFASDYTNDTCLDRLYSQTDINYALMSNPELRDNVYEDVMRAVQLAELRGQLQLTAFALEITE
jgi:hypothetical protein